jgi:hypothetical protein
MRPLAAWTGLARLGPFRWASIAPWRAARVALGVVSPLALGMATDHIKYGAYTALGALPAGIASFQGATRSRVTRRPEPPETIAGTAPRFGLDGRQAEARLSGGPATWPRLARTRPAV